VLGIAVLASVFSANGSYASPQAFTDGMTSAIWIGAAVLAAGALIALLVPGKKQAQEAEPVAEAGLVSA
jgi:cytochrome c biogenesis factor